MKKVLLGLCVMVFMAPVFAFDASQETSDNSKYFNNLSDTGYKYELPSNLSFHSKKEDKNEEVDETADITLDEDDVKPVKKVIKKLENGAQSQPVNPKDVPMNYESFPKFYNNNDVFQQQFMPLY